MNICLIKINCSKGCRITTNGDTISQNNYQYIDTIIFPSKEENAQLIDDAVKIAQQAEIVVLAIGENEQLSREAWHVTNAGNMTGDEIVQLYIHQNMQRYPAGYRYLVTGDLHLHHLTFFK